MKLTRLLLGDIVASNTTRRIRKLTLKNEDVPGSENYITFESPNSFTLKTADGSKGWDGTLEYSTDASIWNAWDGSLLSADNGKLYLRGTGNTRMVSHVSGISSYERWILDGTNISCNGNIENLLDYETVMNGQHPTMSSNCFLGLFIDCTSLISAPDLPATTLNHGCYSNMFRGCTSLISAPELPATTLWGFCYSRMFYGCTSLTTAPKLPATSLLAACCQYMFCRCTNLTTLPELHATTMVDSGYFGMFSGCTSLIINSKQSEETPYEYRIPTSGTGTTEVDALTDMFTNTGGTFTGTPRLNTTYYTQNKPV